MLEGETLLVCEQPFLSDTAFLLEAETCEEGGEGDFAPLQLWVPHVALSLAGPF